MSIVQKYTIRHSCENLVAVWLLKINSSSRLMIWFWQKTCWKPARASEQNGLTITRLLHTTLDLTGPPAASGVQDLSAEFYNKITSLGFEHQRILSLSLSTLMEFFFDESCNSQFCSFMRSREACGVVPRKRKEELDVETRCVGFSPGSSVKARKRWKVASKFPK